MLKVARAVIPISKFIIRMIRKALYSRHLFNNWLELLFRSALIELGFNLKLKARINGCTINLEPSTFKYFVSWASTGIFKAVDCKNGKLFVNEVEVDDINDMMLHNSELLAKVLGWRYDENLKHWYKNSIRFKNMHIFILTTFDYGEYSFLNVKNKDVVDVGAFIGDTAIYFALKGARRVIAIEPHPEAYKEMLENIKLNSLESVIVPINAGLASKPGWICIDKTRDTGGAYHRPCNINEGVPAITLADIINKYDIDTNNGVLKIDCEGCERDIILNDYEYVKLFKEIAVEYHQNLLEILKALIKDYRCEILIGDTRIGVAYCTKR